MRKINFYCKDGRGCFTATMDLGANYTKESVLAQKEELVNNVKKDLAKSHPNLESVEILIPTKSKYKKELLMKVGQEVASGWGGVCLDLTTYENMVEFKCNEFGENFTTHMTYADIEKQYGKVLRG